jgi:hypothetical protein
MMRLTADQTAEMIKVAAKPPPERAQMSETLQCLVHIAADI